MTSHKHAALMLQYAQDALETDKPWERWEVAASSNKWDALPNHPGWFDSYDYRRKPQTLTYTVAIPEPLREAPEIGKTYYPADPTNPNFFLQIAWLNDESDNMWLKRGLCFATADDAIAAAKAMLPIKGEEA